GGSQFSKIPRGPACANKSRGRCGACEVPRVRTKSAACALVVCFSSVVILMPYPRMMVFIWPVRLQVLGSVRRSVHKSLAEHAAGYSGSSCHRQNAKSVESGCTCAVLPVSTDFAFCRWQLEPE